MFTSFFRRILWILVLISCFAIHSPSAHSQVVPQQIEDPEPLIEANPGQPSDSIIQSRIQSIFNEIEALTDISVAVDAGVVTLKGDVANESAALKATNLATRLEGVVTVEDEMSRTLAVSDNVGPLIDQARADLQNFSRGIPLMLFAFVTFLIVAFIAHLLARWMWLWRKIAPNPFLSELLSQAIRVAGIILGLVMALNIVGQTALMGTILGGAGVLGIAIGFAVRDSLENYISSIMLSLRQPFRANDRVVIDEHEGIVVRLTSRATILMTLDGNHLRIPNSTVFKAVILNYTRNPERRFNFDLGVDAEDDPVAAMGIGLDAIKSLDFVLDDPKPTAIIDTVGDSNIVLTFHAWVNQAETDFGKARSLAIRKVKDVIEENGFTLPEPIYRLRLDPVTLEGLGTMQGADMTATPSAPLPPSQAKPPAAKASAQTEQDVMDVSPDTHLEDKANEERAEGEASDLLDDDRPVE